MIRTLVMAAALAGGAALAVPASAAPLAAAGAIPAVAGSNSALLQDVQWRPYGYGPRYYGYRGGYYGRGPAVGAGIAAGVIGGALAAGALASRPAPVYVAPPAGYSVEDVDAVAYCSRRFRSYNPETGTYIGAGGVVRYCP